MLCPNSQCGQRVSEGSNFCAWCGAAISAGGGPLAAEEFRAAIRSFEGQYPGRIRIPEPGEDLPHQLDPAHFCECESRQFRNDDRGMLAYISQHLEGGDEVLVLPADRTHLMLTAGPRLFRRPAADADEARYQQYADAMARGFTALLDRRYDQACALFADLVKEYPSEAGPCLGMCEAAQDGELDIGDALALLHRAETLIRSGQSRYPVDKYRGLPSLYCLRATEYIKRSCQVDSGRAMESLLEGAGAECANALLLDPACEKAKQLKAMLRRLGR